MCSLYGYSQAVLKAAPCLGVGLCRGAFLALCEWRWVAELTFCCTGCHAFTLVPAHSLGSAVGLSRKLRLVEGNRQPWGALLALPAPCPLLFQHTGASGCHRSLGFVLTWLQALPGQGCQPDAAEERALGLCHRSRGHQQSPALTGSTQHSPCGLLSAGNCLFFGCRQKSKDFYCQAEWDELVTKGFLTLFTAFSRDQVSSQRRRVGTETARAALMGLCQCFWPLYLLAWPAKDLLGWHSGHLAPPHHLGAGQDPHQPGRVWLSRAGTGLTSAGADKALASFVCLDHVSDKKLPSLSGGSPGNDLSWLSATLPTMSF